MPGFPNRIRRSSLGPSDLIDTWPVTDERKAIPANTYKLAWWQLAGVNLTAYRATFGVRMSAGTLTTFYQAIAFDPNGALPLISWVHTATGVYTYSLPSSEYPDEQGNPVTVDFLGGIATPQTMNGSNWMRLYHIKTGPRSGSVNVGNISASTGFDLVNLSDGSEFTLQLV